MIGKLTAEELEALPEKQKRNLRVQPKVLALYQENEYLEAYAKHTDLRIAENGYQAAVGSGDNWEEHGNLQRDFLISRGLKPGHMLLDIGCGTGRLARKVTPYLGFGYVGMDISNDAVRWAMKLAESEGWTKHQPQFVCGYPPANYEFDFAWAYSVFIHLPIEIVQDVMTRVAGYLKPTGQLLFSYSPEKVSIRTGLKQFRHPFAEYERAAAPAGLRVEDVPDWVVKAGYAPGRWSGGMRVACARRIA